MSSALARPVGPFLDRRKSGHRYIRVPEPEQAPKASKNGANQSSSPPSIFDLARNLYGINEVKAWFPHLTPELETEAGGDVVKLVALALSHEGSEDLESAREWFRERLYIDFPDPIAAAEDASDAAVQPSDNASAEEAKETPQRPPESPATPQKSTAIGSGKKSTAIGRSGKKALPLGGKKAPPLAGQKAPTNYLPRVLVCVVGWEELKRLLVGAGQDEWTTNLRMAGLFTLLDFISRVGPCFLSSDLAHQFVSPLKRCNSSSTKQQPLAVLEQIGLIERVQPHVYAPNCRRAAKFRVHPDYANRAKKKIVLLNPKQIEKLDNFDQRRTARLNRRHPWRAPLLATLETLSLSPTGKALALDLLSAQRKEKNVREAIELLNGKRERQGKVHPADTGQIITPVTRFPRELKPELLIAGQPISICDISHAHHSFLPRLVEERIGYLRGSHAPSQKIEPYEAERDRLRHFLSKGDYYRMWCKNPEDDQERQQKKELLTMILNWRNSKAERNRLYRWMRATFPLTFGIIEDIKRDDHRRISRKLQNFTARVINAALLTVQDHGIPAIPDVDAILCPADHKEAVCNAIGEEIFGLAGVCAKIGGIRFAPEQFPPQKVCATCKQHGRITPVVTGLETCPECGFPPDICCPF